MDDDKFIIEVVEAGKSTGGTAGSPENQSKERPLQSRDEILAVIRDIRTHTQKISGVQPVSTSSASSTQTPTPPTDDRPKMVGHRNAWHNWPGVTRMREETSEEKKLREAEKEASQENGKSSTGAPPPPPPPPPGGTGTSTGGQPGEGGTFTLNSATFISNTTNMTANVVNLVSSTNTVNTTNNTNNATNTLNNSILNLTNSVNNLGSNILTINNTTNNQNNPTPPPPKPPKNPQEQTNRMLAYGTAGYATAVGGGSSAMSSAIHNDYGRAATTSLGTTAAVTGIVAAGATAVSSAAIAAGTAAPAAAALAAVAAPAAAALGALAATALAYNAVQKAFLDRARELMPLSGNIQAADAVAMIREFQRDRREAAAMGGGMANLIDAQSRANTALSDILLPIKTEVLASFANLAEVVATYLKFFKDSGLGDVIKVLYEVSPLGLLGKIFAVLADWFRSAQKDPENNNEYMRGIEKQLKELAQAAQMPGGPAGVAGWLQGAPGWQRGNPNLGLSVPSTLAFRPGDVHRAMGEFK